GENAGARRQTDLQERLSLVFQCESHFCKSLSLGCDQCRNFCTLGYRREHTGVREPHPFQIQRGRLIRLTVIAKRRLRRKVPQGSKVRISFLYVHAFKPATFGSCQLQRPSAFDQHFSRFTLRILEREEWSLSSCGAQRLLHRNQELVGPLARSVNA